MWGRPATYEYFTNRRPGLSTVHGESLQFDMHQRTDGVWIHLSRWLVVKCTRIETGWERMERDKERGEETERQGEVERERERQEEKHRYIYLS